MTGGYRLISADDLDLISNLLNVLKELQANKTLSNSLPQSETEGGGISSPGALAADTGNKVETKELGGQGSETAAVAVLPDEDNANLVSGWSSDGAAIRQ